MQKIDIFKRFLNIFAFSTIGCGAVVGIAYGVQKDVDNRDWEKGVAVTELRAGDNVTDMYLIPDLSYTYTFDTSDPDIYLTFLECTNGCKIEFEEQFPGWGDHGADVVSIFESNDLSEDFLCMALPQTFMWCDEWRSDSHSIQFNSAKLHYDNPNFIIKYIHSLNNFRPDVWAWLSHVKFYKTLPQYNVYANFC